MKLRSLVFAGAVAAALSSPAGAMAATDTLTQTTTGVAASEIALSVPVAAVFGTVFKPGANVSSTGGTVTAVSTNPNWTLSAAESGGDGKMSKSATPACTNSAADLANAASIAVVPAVANAAIASTTRTLSGTPQVVASATAVPLATTVFNTTFSQSIGATELLATGCTYTLTTTYTLAAGA